MKYWDLITHQCPNFQWEFNLIAIEIRARMSNYIPYKNSNLDYLSIL